MAKIFCTKTITESSFKSLEQKGHEIVIWDDLNKGPIDRQTLISSAKDCEGLITMLSDKIDEELLEQCPNLKVISQYAVGYNNIDTAATKKRGIVVTNTPDVLTHATAELAFALLISCARKIVQAAKNVEEDKWKGWEPKGFLGKSLKDTTVGIIGAGRIGSSFAKMCHGAFDSNILYYSRSKKEVLESELGAKKTDLKELLQNSDVISLHCPLNDETKLLLDKDTLSYCKKDAIIINTARGEVINQDDLIELLEQGHFHSIGMDVTTPEPLPHSSKLKSFENVLIIPHIGSATETARKDMSDLVCKNIENVLENLSPLTPVTV